MIRQPFAVIQRGKESVTYEADFWEGPDRPGAEGRYVRRRVTAVRDTRGGIRDHSPSLSYYGRLRAAFR